MGVRVRAAILQPVPPVSTGFGCVHAADEAQSGQTILETGRCAKRVLARCKAYSHLPSVFVTYLDPYFDLAILLPGVRRSAATGRPVAATSAAAAAVMATAPHVTCHVAGGCAAATTSALPRVTAAPACPAL